MSCTSDDNLVEFEKLAGHVSSRASHTGLPTLLPHSNVFDASRVVPQQMTLPHVLTVIAHQPCPFESIILHL